MDPKTFTTNKIILEEFYKKRIKHNNDITFEQETGITSNIFNNEGIIFRTRIKLFGVSTNENINF